ncbi:MAG: fluoride efflux transporter CrcB [Acidobacteria bacterium]|nr:fluoride efflux transporter CrcB [Acidobacteriota bacterium]
MLYKVLSLGLAGAAGTIARYGLAGIVQRFNKAAFPLGTLAVNLAGCFLAGLIWTIFENNAAVTKDVKILVLVGFMGAFTTFSAFILETGALAQSSGMLYAVANIALQNILGFTALFAGMALGKVI